MYKIDEIRNKILQGNVLDVLKQIPDESIDCIITSPPYWCLRNYGEETNTIWNEDKNCKHEWDIVGKVQSDAAIKQGPNSTIKQSHTEPKDLRSAFCKKCSAWYGQLGLEPTLELYLEHMLQITEELKRVLKGTGVCFWNHGDNYGGAISVPNAPKLGKRAKDRICQRPAIGKQKCMIMQNYRLILRMLDEQNWLLRNICIWNKPNHMPSSVKDRFANSYEPVFMLVKSKKYLFDLDAVRVPHKTNENRPMGIIRNREYGYNSKLNKLRGYKIKGDKGIVQKSQHHGKDVNYTSGGKNPGDVWIIPTRPFPEAHFATFPQGLVEPMIQASCPKWICKKCSKARVRITKIEYNWQTKGKTKGEKQRSGEMATIQGHALAEHQTIGWTDCSCFDDGNKWRPGIILDCFLGSGTTAVVAKKLKRDYLGIELNSSYIEIANKRIEATPKPLF